MEFDKNQLQKKLDCYFEGKLTKNELGKWANRAYYDLMRGGYLENRKIILYPFLRTISKFHIEENEKEDMYPSSEESVKKIQKILYGEMDFDFTVELSIPIEIDRMFKENVYCDKKRYDIFLKLRDSVADYLKGKYKYQFQSWLYSEEGMEDCVEEKFTISKDIRIQFEKIMSYPCQRKTIQDLLEESIFCFYKNLFSDNILEGEGGVNFRLFAKKSKQDCLIAKQLFFYLDSYIGNRNFYLFISYRSGVPDILLAVD